MATLVTRRADDPVGLDGLPEHDAYFDVDDRDFDAPRARGEHVVDVDRLEVEVEITDQVDHHYRVRVGRLAGVESERRWK